MDGDSKDFQLLFVDNEEGLLRYVSKNLGAMGYDVLTTPDWEGGPVPVEAFPTGSHLR